MATQASHDGTRTGPWAGAALVGLLALALAPAAGGTKKPITKAPLPHRYVVNSVGMKLAQIPAGKFVMGSPATEKERDPTDEGPQHPVQITRPFLPGPHRATPGPYQHVLA